MKVTVAAEDRKREVEIERLGRGTSSFLVRLEGGQACEVQVLARRGSWLTLDIDGCIHGFNVFKDGRQLVVQQPNGSSSSLQVIDRKRPGESSQEVISIEGGVSLKAQMPGKVIRVLKKLGESVEAGEGLVIIESMKMQNELRSPQSGIVRSCSVRDGDNVNSGQLLFEVE